MQGATRSFSLIACCTRAADDTPLRAMPPDLRRTRDFIASRQVPERSSPDIFSIRGLTGLVAGYADANHEEPRISPIRTGVDELRRKWRTFPALFAFYEPSFESLHGSMVEGDQQSARGKAFSARASCIPALCRIQNEARQNALALMAHPAFGNDDGTSHQVVEQLESMRSWARNMEWSLRNDMHGEYPAGPQWLDRHLSMLATPAHVMHEVVDTLAICWDSNTRTLDLNALVEQVSDRHRLMPRDVLLYVLAMPGLLQQCDEELGGIAKLVLPPMDQEELNSILAQAGQLEKLKCVSLGEPLAGADGKIAQWDLRFLDRARPRGAGDALEIETWHTGVYRVHCPQSRAVTFAS